MSFLEQTSAQQTATPGIPGKSPSYRTPNSSWYEPWYDDFAAQYKTRNQYDQPNIDHSQIIEQHLPATPVIVEQVRNTDPVVFGRAPVATICYHCQNTVSSK